MFAVPQKWWGEKMLLILSNTPISKHYCLCLNPCLDIPTKSKFYVKNLVTKHNKDLKSKSLIYRKIGPMAMALRGILASKLLYNPSDKF